MTHPSESSPESGLDIAAVAVPGQQHHPLAGIGESVFPMVYLCHTSDAPLERAVAWVEAKGETLLQEATKNGAVLLRGFPLKTPEDFDAMIRALDLPNFPYQESLSNAVRVNSTERVFSANEAPPEVQIFFHHEMAQTPLYPKWIMFFCEIAPPVGGATPICRSDVLYQRLAEQCPKFIADCETKGLQYTNVMPGENDARSGMGRSWRSTLGVETKQQAESRLAALNYSFRWLDGDCLRATTPPLPAVMEVSPGRKTFFNQLIAAYSGWKDSRNDPSDAIRHGDGSKLDADAVAKAIELAGQLTFDVQWQPGDAVVVDNRIAMHARRPFEGRRKVLASLAVKQTQAFGAEPAAV
jgi:alpha-ketoglutarate-dependent taurine dioxygenase